MAEASSSPLPPRTLRSERVSLLERRREIVNDFLSWSTPLTQLSPTITSEPTYVQVLFDRLTDYHIEYSKVRDRLLQYPSLSIADINKLEDEHRTFFSRYAKVRDLIQSWLNRSVHPATSTPYVQSSPTVVGSLREPPPIPPRSPLSRTRVVDHSSQQISPGPPSGPAPVLQQPEPTRRVSLNPFVTKIENDSLWWDTLGQASTAQLPTQFDPFGPSTSIDQSRHTGENELIDPFGELIDLSSVVEDDVITHRTFNIPNAHRSSNYNIAETPFAPLHDRPRREPIRPVNLIDDGFVHTQASTNPFVDQRANYIEDAKVERLTLPIFKGDIMEFPGWWNRWNVTYHNRKGMSGATKLLHLLRKVDGPAKSPIEHLPITNQAYDIAIDLLYRRFFKREKIIIHHVSSLLVSKIVPEKSSAPILRKSCDEIGSHIRALQSLNVDLTGDTSTVLAPMIYSRLPNDIRTEWANDAKGKTMTVANVLGFLENAVENRERSEQIRILYPDSSEKKAVVGKSSVFLNNEEIVSSHSHPPCPACQRDHHPKSCSVLKKLPPWKRLDLIKGSNRCTKCLGPHIQSQCSRNEVCIKCGNQHSTLLCVKKKSDQANGAKVTTVETALASCSKSPSVLFQTALINVRFKGRQVVARCLFDLASNHSYATASILKKIHAVHHGTELLQVQTFGGNLHSPSPRKKYYLTLNGLTPPYETPHQVEVFESQHICRDIPTVSDQIVSSFPHLDGLVLADYQTNVSTIDLLIGLDYSSRIIRDKIIRGPKINSPIAQETAFGYVVFGRTGDSSSVGTSMCCFTNSVDKETIDFDLAKFFQLESLGIQREESKTDTEIFADFQSSVTFVDNRYEVRLPWKPDPPTLGDSFKGALQVLKSLQKRFTKDSWLEDQYRSTFKEYASLGFIEKVPTSEYVPDHRVFYIPHHPVIKLAKETTKIRPVFNGSKKSTTGASLNDCLLTGINLGSELLDILLRFRTKHVAFTSDLKKAFLQVAIHPEDRDVLRFLWFNEDGFLETWRFQRVPFGLTASSFLLAATIHHHLSQQPPSTTVSALQDNLYVDDFDHTEDAVDQAHHVAVEAANIMKDAGMELREFTTSNEELRSWFEIDGLPQSTSDTVSKPLGIVWNLKQDTISIPSVQFNSCKFGNLTKRSILSLVSKVYDPLGLVAPLVIPCKILLQKIWARNLDWNECVPDDISVEARSCFEHLLKIPEISFARSSINDSSGSSLHVFTDASPEGYGTAVYIRSPNGCNLLCAKSRVAPIKKLTLPRLELLGCLIGTRLLKRIQREIPLLKDHPFFFWCDSTIALSWIFNPPEKDIFVKNRVREILGNFPDTTCFRYIPGVDNPADLLTRQSSADQCLLDIQFWKSGPAWLQTLDWPSSPLPVSQVQTTLLTINEELPDILDFDRHSSLQKALRVIAYVRRWKWKDTSLAVLPSPAELDDALTTAIKYVQQREFKTEYECLVDNRQVPKDSPLICLNPVLGSDGIIRSFGRTDRSVESQDSSGLVILPSKSRLTYLIIHDCHQKEFHSGVDHTLSSIRFKYWIIKGRQSVKSALKSCFYCKRFHSKAFSPPESALPENRVKEASPFSKVGVDNFGPYNSRDHSKVYGLIFSCCVTRGVILEVVPDLSASSFLLAFRRVQARVGSIELIISDNAKCFRKSAEILSSQVKWQFIPDRSPHWGGFYERLVAVVKNCIKKAVGKALLSFEEITTLFVEIEGAVNRRPLTYIGDDRSSPTPLRPIDLIKPSVPLIFESSGTGDGLKKGYRQSRIALASFWNKWRIEYLPTLRKWRKASKQSSMEPKIGDVVQLHQENTKNKLQYPLARIHSLIRGKDGQVRAAMVTTKNGQFRRALHLLYPLELQNEDHHSSDSVQFPQTLTASRDKDKTIPSVPLPTEVPHAEVSVLVKPVKTTKSRLRTNSVGQTQATRSGRQIRRPARFIN